MFDIQEMYTANKDVRNLCDDAYIMLSTVQHLFRNCVHFVTLLGFYIF